jgi:hypothetical protein
LQALYRQHLGADEDDGAGVLRGGRLHGAGLRLRVTRVPTLTSRTAQQNIFRLNPDFGENRLDYRQILVTVIYIKSVN